MKYMKLFEGNKLKTYEIKNIARKFIIAAAMSGVGTADSLRGYTEEDKEKIIAEIDYICFKLEKWY